MTFMRAKLSMKNKIWVKVTMNGLPRLPINLLAVELNANEYPQKNH